MSEISAITIRRRLRKATGMPIESYMYIIKNIMISQKEDKEQSHISSSKDSCITLPGKHGAYLSASATIEAALVLPIFIYAVMAVMYIVQITAVRLHIQEALYKESRQLAKYAYAADCVRKGLNKSNDISDSKVQSIVQKGITLAAAQAIFIDNVGSEYANKVRIAGGNAGYVMLGSKLMDTDRRIILEVKYMINNPFNIFGIKNQIITQRAEAVAWIGDDRCIGVDGIKTMSNSAEESVYITENSDVYHTNSECTYLKPSLRSVAVTDINKYRNESGAIYYPCEYCRDKPVDDVFYITKYGDCYHNSRNCSRLSRSFVKVPADTVKHLKKCSKCASFTD